MSGSYIDSPQIDCNIKFNKENNCFVCECGFDELNLDEHGRRLDMGDNIQIFFNLECPECYTQYTVDYIGNKINKA
ncbi:MAG: hypothetical protein K9K32_04605 [Halanaerobiales bacterium]|nr:hypothetical protein [Halanaerobiales bacterium]